MTLNPSPDVASAATRLLVVRHGESEWNALGRWQGQADPELSARGEQQAAQAADALAGIPLDRIVSSDLSRARRTAAILAEQLGVSAIGIEVGLREVDVGEWSGLTRPQIESRWPRLLSAWSEGRLEATPGGETLTALRARVTEAISRILQASRHSGETILVVSHRRAISALEESAGVRPVRAGHLAGRRFTADESRILHPGEPIDLLAEVAPAQTPG
ncbi:MAG: histidine phosphatase family protein [Actinomycetota bacterium]